MSARAATAWLCLGLTACAEPLALPAGPAPGAYLGPTVVAADPPGGAHGVPLDYPVRVTLSEAADAATVLSALGARALSGAAFPFTTTVEQAGRTLTLRALWPAGEAVRVTLTGALTNAGGVGLRDQDRADLLPDTPFALTFTAGADKLAEPPRILAQVPAGGVLGAGDAPGVRFSKRMRPGSAAVRFSAHGAPVAHRLRWLDADTRLVAEPDAALPPGTLYGLTIEAATDAWGLALPGPRSFAFATRTAAGHVVINEAVNAPESDWGDSAGGNGVAFDGVPGTGTVSASDEYVELYNGSNETVSLTGWSLEQLDGTNQTHVIGAGGGVVERVVPAGSPGAFPPGAYLVIGNAVGDLGDAVTLVLRDELGLERDRVTLPGAPAGGEAWARSPNGGDTDDAADWQAAPATPGGAN